MSQQKRVRKRRKLTMIHFIRVLTQQINMRSLKITIFQLLQMVLMLLNMITRKSAFMKSLVNMVQLRDQSHIINQRTHLNQNQLPNLQSHQHQFQKRKMLMTLVMSLQERSKKMQRLSKRSQKMCGFHPLTKFSGTITRPTRTQP